MSFRLFGVALAVFFAIDMVWLGAVARGFYRDQLGDLLRPQANWGAAVLFYLLFVVGLVVFVIDPAVAGFEEAILLDRDGNVSEGAGENVFAVKGGVLRTPGLDSSILPGITRDAALRIARDLGVETAEGTTKIEELLGADEVFFTGTAAEITPVREIDGRRIGNGGRGPITEKIQSVFFRAVRGREPRYAEWLSRV